MSEGQGTGAMWERYRFATLTWGVLAIIVAAGLGFGVGQVLGKFGSSPKDGTVSTPVGTEPATGVQLDSANDATRPEPAPRVRKRGTVPARAKRTPTARRKRAVAAPERRARDRTRPTGAASSRRRAPSAAAKRPPVAVVKPPRRVVVPPPPPPQPPAAPRPAPRPVPAPPPPLGGGVFDDSG